jgi:hypothetical protein
MLREIDINVKMKILQRSKRTASQNGIESNWYRVQVGRTIGWVLGKDIDILVDPNNINPGVEDTSSRWLKIGIAGSVFLVLLVFIFLKFRGGTQAP